MEFYRVYEFHLAISVRFKIACTDCKEVENNIF